MYTDYFGFEIVQEFARKNGITFISLLGEFLKAKDQKLFFSYDGHFTPAANDIVARALSESEYSAVKEALAVSN